MSHDKKSSKIIALWNVWLNGIFLRKVCKSQPTDGLMWESRGIEHCQWIRVGDQAHAQADVAYLTALGERQIREIENQETHYFYSKNIALNSRERVRFELEKYAEKSIFERQDALVRKVKIEKFKET